MKLRLALFIVIFLAFAGNLSAIEKVYHRSTRIEIPYQFKDGDLAAFGTMELHYTTDGGKTWKSAGKDPDGRSPFVFHAPHDGTYWFAAQVYDSAGVPRPLDLDQYRPKIEHVVDTKAPRLVVSVNEKEHEGRRILTVTWDCDDENLDPASVRIETKDTPKDSQWHKLEVRDIAAQVARFEIDPQDIERMYMLRVVIDDYAGNSAIGTITKNFTSEPVIKYQYDQLETPKPGQYLTEGGGRTVDAGLAADARLLTAIHYNVNDAGPTGIKTVELYYTTDNGVTWHFAGLDPDNVSPVLFAAPAEGQYGFKIVVTNRAGVSNGQPQTGDKPETVVWIDKTRPRVRMETPLGGEILTGGSQLLVKWHAEDHCPDQVRLEYSPDAGRTWKPIRTDLPMSGQLLLEVPRVDSDSYKLRVVCIDKAGHRADAETTQPLIISSASPKVRLKVEQNVKLPKIAARDPENRVVELPEEMLMQAVLMRSQGRYAEALVVYDALLKKYPERASLMNDMAGTYVSMGRPENAVPLYTRAVGLDPRNVLYNYNLAYALFGLKRYGEAKTHFQRTVDLMPTHYSANIHLAKIAIWEGMYAQARQRLERILALPNLRDEWRDEAQRLLDDWGYRPDRPGRNRNAETLTLPSAPSSAGL